MFAAAPWELDLLGVFFFSLFALLLSDDDRGGELSVREVGSGPSRGHLAAKGNRSAPVCRDERSL